MPDKPNILVIWGDDICLSTGGTSSTTGQSELARIWSHIGVCAGSQS